MRLLLLLLMILVHGMKRKLDNEFEANDEILHNDPSFDELEEIAEHPLGAKIL